MALSVKLNTKKHLFSFLITLVLLFSLNLNIFAVDTMVLSFYGQPFKVLSQGQYIESSVTVTEGVYQDVHYTKYSFPSGTSYAKLLTTGHDGLTFHVGSTYKFMFASESSYADYYLSVCIMFYNAQNELVDGVVLVDGYFPHNRSSSDGSYVVNQHSGSFTIPSNSDVVGYGIVVMVGDDTNEYYHSDIFLYDFVCYPLSEFTSKPIVTPSLDALDSIIDTNDELLEEVFSDDIDLDSLYDFDFSSYNDGMEFIRTVFNTLIETLELQSVLVFSLLVGLATFIVGRKVG